MATLFLIVLVAVSGTFFGLKVARAHRGEPWVASETFKNDMALLGPYGVRPSSLPAPPPRRGPRARTVTPRRPVRARVRRTAKATAGQGRDFALALSLAASAFTTVCALLGMLPWEVSLGTLSATGLMAALYLEVAPPS